MKSSRLPVFDLGELELFDSEEVWAGNQAGLNGDPEPSAKASRAFWHGWRIGCMQADLMEPDTATLYMRDTYLRLRTLLH